MLKAPEGLHAGAIKTAFSGTRSAGNFESGGERLASAMQSNRGGTGRDLFIGSEGVHRHAIHFYVFQGAGIVRFQMGQFASRARTWRGAANRLRRTIERQLLRENF